MQPAARLSAAIEILDIYLSGMSVEKALTNWARRSRFAGSKDRVAIRDIVFACLRKRKSYAVHGGGETGRGLVYAHASIDHTFEDVEALFSGEGHAPARLTPNERAIFGVKEALPWAARHDMPDWLRPELEASLGSKLPTICSAMTRRAPVFLRVNLRKTSRAIAQAELKETGIKTVTHPLASTVLEVIENPRKVANSTPYLEGRIELQDAASQAICEGLPAAGSMLDYCAGGGGKVLAYGALHPAELFAHDLNTGRMRDLPSRADRAGVNVDILTQKACQRRAPFELVLCDVPCSGSGSWRRAPEGKWSLDGDQLTRLLETQRQILDEAARLMQPGGHLIYVTCSVLQSENKSQIHSFISRNSSHEVVFQKQYLPQDGGDGFYVAHLTQAA